MTISETGPPSATGARSGMGLATANVFARAGAAVVPAAAVP